MAWRQDTIPVVITGNWNLSGQIDTESFREEFASRLGKNLSKFDRVVLLTGGSELLGLQVAWKFYCHGGNVGRLIHLQPENPETAVRPPGKHLFAGQSRFQQSEIPGRCTRLTVVVGGDCEAVWVSHATLARVGLAVPIGSTGGVAAGRSCGRCQTERCKLNLGLAARRAGSEVAFRDDRWHRITSRDLTPATAVRVLCQSILESLKDVHQFSDIGTTDVTIWMQQVCNFLLSKSF